MLYESGLHENDAPNYNAVAGGIYAEWKKQNQQFQQSGARAGTAASGSPDRAGNCRRSCIAREFSWDLLPTLGVQPALGRDFTQADDSPAANGTVMLSWGLWKRRFGGDPAILNQTIYLDAKPYTVIGVMPAWFDFPDPSTQLWTPVYHDKPEDDDDLVQQPHVSRRRAAETGSQRGAGRGRSEPHLAAHPQCAPQRSIRIQKRQQPSAAGAHGRRHQEAALRAAGSDLLPAADCLPQCGQSAGSACGGAPQGAGYPHRAGRGLAAPDRANG